MSEFSDRPLVAGSLTGIRSFRIDKYGRLMATQISSVWTPGENVARCFRELISPTANMFMQSIMPMPHSYGGGWFTTGAMVDPRPKGSSSAAPSKESHAVGKLDCTCGFYAYFDNGPNTYHHKGQMKALVEGYGVVTVGSRGFRAAKAKITTLIIPDKRVNHYSDLVRNNYPDVPVFTSKCDALEAHPLTPPAPLSPDSTPDFWTRDTL